MKPTCGLSHYRDAPPLPAARPCTNQLEPRHSDTVVCEEASPLQDEGLVDSNVDSLNGHPSADSDDGFTESGGDSVDMYALDAEDVSVE